MNFTENLEHAKNFAIETAMAAKDKAVQLAAIAKANIAIYAEEDKVRKAQQQLGQLYYRDYAVGEEMDSAEYLPWCHKIDESNALIAELRERIEQLRAAEGTEAEENAEEADCCCGTTEETPAEEHCCCGTTEEVPAEEHCCCGTTEETPAEEHCCCGTTEETPAEEHCCCEKPEQTPAEPDDTAIEIHIAGQKDGSAE